MIDTSTLVSATLTSASAAVAICAVYKWYKTKQELDNIYKKYESDIEVQRSLMHHYCTLTTLPLLKKIIPSDCEHFHERLSKLCVQVCQKYMVSQNRILDVGSATSCASFYLAALFKEVVATDTSYPMIVASKRMNQFKELVSPFPAEGLLRSTYFHAKLSGHSCTNVTFWDENVCSLVYTCGKFDCILIANTLTELREPARFLSDLHNYVTANGILVVVDAYNWPEKVMAPPEETKELKSSELIGKLLGPRWSLLEKQDLPFYIAQSERLANVGVAEATVWQCLPELV